MRGPLLDPEELAALLASSAPPVLADVRWTLGGPPGRPEFEAGHLPGAQYVDLETELSGAPGHGGRHPLPDPVGFQTAMRRLGVRTDRAVVTYDQATSLAASRLWWLLTDAGHEETYVLDGGFDAWRATGRPVESGPARAVPVGDVVLRPGQRPQLAAAGTAAALAAGRAVVDVRSAERYRGENETIDPVAGHIPGAVSRPAADNLEPDGRFRPAAVIAERFEELAEPVLYCGSGITAAQTLLALESAGLTGAIYPGSWSDWIIDPDRPVARGPG